MPSSWAELHDPRGPLVLIFDLHTSGQCNGMIAAQCSSAAAGAACVSCCRVVMYFFVGKMLVLQPDMEHNFVRPGEEYHPMLPTGPGLYTLRTPTALDAMAANAKKEVRVSILCAHAAWETCVALDCKAAQVQLAAQPCLSMAGAGLQL